MTHMVHVVKEIDILELVFLYNMFPFEMYMTILYIEVCLQTF